MSRKQKIQGVENKELILFIAIIVIVIVLLIFEGSMFKGRTDITEKLIETEKQLQEMADVNVDSEQKTIYKVVNDIVELMNNKDYDKLYEMLTEDYKNYYFRDYNSFKTFMDVYAKESYYPKYSSYYRDGDLYYVMINFLKSKYTREDLLSPSVNKVDTIVLKELKNGEFSFALNGFVENIVHNNSKTVNGITFTLQNSVRNTETMKTTVVISNKSDKDVSVSTTNIEPNISGSNTSKVSATTSVNLSPNEIGALTIEYYFQYNSGREFKGVSISGVKFEDGAVLDSINIYK